jgi:hypothetical protein
MIFIKFIFLIEYYDKIFDEFLTKPNFNIYFKN